LVLERSCLRTRPSKVLGKYLQDSCHTTYEESFLALYPEESELNKSATTFRRPAALLAASKMRRSLCAKKKSER